METHNPYLIVMHIAFGCIGYAGGIVALLVRKGSPLHIQSGRVFSYLMIVPVLATFPFMIERFLPLAIVMAIATLYLVISAILSFRLESPRALAISRMLIIVPILLFTASGLQLVRSIASGSFTIIGPVLLMAVFASLIVGDGKLIRTANRSYHFCLKRHLYRMSLAFGFVTIAVLNINAIELGMPTQLTVILPIGFSLVISYYFLKKESATT